MVKPAQIDAIYLHPDDNIGVAARNLKAGEVISLASYEITLQEEIPTGHKFAMESLADEDSVFK